MTLLNASGDIVLLPANAGLGLFLAKKAEMKVLRARKALALATNDQYALAVIMNREDELRAALLQIQSVFGIKTYIKLPN